MPRSFSAIPFAKDFRFAAALLLLSPFLALPLPAQAPKEAEPPTKPVPSTAPALQASTHELTSSDLEAFLDGMMPAQLNREDIAGAVVAVVKDGHVLFAKGYGFSDYAKRTPVSSENTLFRLGSISKLFTWTSVMQLVEQGKLDLDRDVNSYLDFQIPAAFGKPITLRNIMTHTSGFEETLKELFVVDSSQMRPLDDYLKNHIPARIFPPGVTPAYSNYATTLAGYIVQRVSGKPFDHYAAENILMPLGMTHATFVQPLPGNLAALMSNGYDQASQGAKPFEFVQAYPAGSVSISATDACKFMIAHLQNGQFEGHQILKAETAKLMHARQFAADPRLNAMALGFYEESRNGHRIIGHGGDTIYFHSDLHLILDSNVGFFVSYNSAGKGEISPRSILFNAFLDRYFPYTTPAVTASRRNSDAFEVPGFYLTSRRGEKTFVRLLELLNEQRAFFNSDGTLSVSSYKQANGELTRYDEIGPLLYREVHGQDHLAFHKNADGRMEFSEDFPAFVFEKARFPDNKHLNMFVFFPSITVMALAVIFWPIGAMLRRRYDRPLNLSSPERRLRLAVRLVCIIDLLAVLGWLWFLSAADDIANLNRSRDPILYVFQILGVVGAFGTLLVLLYAFQNVTKPGHWFWAKLFDAALALGCLGFTWFLWHWNLINFDLHY